MSKKIVITEGCIAYSTTIDGRPLYGDSHDTLSPKERLDLIVYLLDQIHTEVCRGTIGINSLINLFQYDDYITDKEPCDQCGDYMTQTIYNI